MVDQPAALPRPIAMEKPAPDDAAPIPVFTSSDRIAVPADAVQLLRNCIQSRKDGKGANDQILAAIAPICAEARRSQAMPEHLLISIKELCRSLPEFESIRGARERDGFLDTVVKLSIEEFYRA
jgi:hypothetical protein